MKMQTVKPEKPDNPPLQSIPLFPEGAPGSETWVQQEETLSMKVLDGLKVVRNVTQPTLTVYLPENPNGTAVIVCPGGAWHFLSIDLEGTDIARWLNKRNITVFILKYRLLRTEKESFEAGVWARLNDPQQMEAAMKPYRPLILADGQQALRLVRQRAGEWGVDPRRIGMMGFSAGGMLTACVALQHDPESRPDFAAPIYAAPFEEVPVPEDAPPLFLLCAADDDMATGVSTRLFTLWKAAGRPVELHIYSRGGHGFGLREQGLPSDCWLERFTDWLESLW
jgi:acetyl esterase/lipase